MHRITKIKNTYLDRIDHGKVNPILQAKRAAEGKYKVVIPDPLPSENKDEEQEAEKDDEDDDEVHTYSNPLHIYNPSFPQSTSTSSWDNKSESAES